MAQRIGSRIIQSIGPRILHKRTVIPGFVSGFRASSSLFPVDTRPPNSCIRSSQCKTPLVASSSRYKKYLRHLKSCSHVSRSHQCRPLSSGRRHRDPEQDSKPAESHDGEASKVRYISRSELLVLITIRQSWRFKDCVRMHRECTSASLLTHTTQGKDKYIDLRFTATPRMSFITTR